MIALPSRAKPSVALRPTIVCSPLPAFDADYYYEVWSAFSSAVPLALGQSWRNKVERNFAPGQVRTGWRRDVLLVFAELSDQDIYTSATQADQRVWELGDTFEIFLQPSDWLGYVVLLVAPNNVCLQRCYPNAAAVDSLRSRAVDGYQLDGKTFHSRTWTYPNANHWSVYAEIPARLFGKSLRSLAGCRWRFSFNRYDFTRPRKEPVISSTSPHAKADFHRQQEWGELIFGAPEFS